MKKIRMTAKRREKIQHIMDELARAYPDARPGLDFENAYQLLIATILSAQCTDKQVNKVTPALFRDYPTANDLAEITPQTLEPYIRSCGFYAAKAKNIVAACQILKERYGGEVPSDFEALQTLPGVGRKTANVVVSNAFGADAIAVDTHVFRVSNRLGLARAKDVLETEYQLMDAIPKEKWSIAHHYLIYHGRQVCAARSPKCAVCTLRDWCDFRKEEEKCL